MEGNVIVLQDVFTFEQTGIVEGKIIGRLQPTGIRPKFIEKLEDQGIRLPASIFDPTADHLFDPTYAGDLSFPSPTRLPSAPSAIPGSAMSPAPTQGLIRRVAGRFPYRGEGPEKWPED
jgi:hypothetical protein